MSSLFIIGNCHLNGLIRSTRFFAPAVDVDACAVWSLASRFTSQAQCLDHLSRFDAVFTMPFHRGFWPEIDSDTLSAQLKTVVTYPTVTFGAFHPDVTYIFDRTGAGAVLPGPLGPYQSALAFYGYRRGYSLDDTIRLFRSSVFEKIGYFGAWSAAAEALLQEPKTRAYKFDSYLLSWMREGCFMYNPQHPKIAPIIDIAKEMLPLGGFPVKFRNARPFMSDDLVSSHIWPVYPEIGRYYGLSGDYTFKRESSVSRWPEFMSLAEFIQASYACFAGHDLSQYRCDRVDEWLAKEVDL